jgi:hypothetical protein
VDGAPDATGRTWARAAVPAAIREVALFVRKGAASFEDARLERGTP